MFKFKKRLKAAAAVICALAVSACGIPFAAFAEEAPASPEMNNKHDSVFEKSGDFILRTYNNGEYTLDWTKQWAGVFIEEFAGTESDLETVDVSEADYLEFDLYSSANLNNGFAVWLSSGKGSDAGRKKYDISAIKSGWTHYVLPIAAFNSAYETENAVFNTAALKTLIFEGTVSIADAGINSATFKVSNVAFTKLNHAKPEIKDLLLLKGDGTDGAIYHPGGTPSPTATFGSDIEFSFFNNRFIYITADIYGYDTLTFNLNIESTEEYEHWKSHVYIFLADSFGKWAVYPMPENLNEGDNTVTLDLHYAQKCGLDLTAFSEVGIRSVPDGHWHDSQDLYTNTNIGYTDSSGTDFTFTTSDFWAHVTEEAIGRELIDAGAYKAWGRPVSNFNWANVVVLNKEKPIDLSGYDYLEFDIYISDAEGLKAEIIPDTGNPVWSSVFLRFINGKGDAFENWWHWSIDAKELHTGYNHMRIPTSSIPSTHLTDLAQILMYQENNGAAISPVNNYFIGAVNFCGVNTAAKMDGVYSDNMLFGQNKPIRVTGTGTPGALVKTELTAEKDNRIVRSGECTIPENGIWEIEMQGLPASFDTYTLNFYINGSSDPEKSVKNVIIGELYLASGQSNMAFRMWETPEGADWFNNNTYDRNGNPNIRVLSSGDTYWDGADVPYEPDRNAVETYWAVGNTRDFYDVSAVAYYFADRLQQKLGIPVGVMDASLGGSSIFSWISREAIESDDVLLDYLKNSDRYFDKSNWQTEHSLNNAQQKMTSLYNIKTAPLSSMEISGVIWYQGCNEVGIADGVYAEALKVLRDCYEDTFSYDDGKLPFILTELHAYGFTDPTLPQMWDQMTAAAENNEKMGAVTIYDLPSDWDYSGYTPGGWGIADPIHPYTKKPVGIRLAEAMYAMVYDGSYGESTAPVWNGTKTVDGKYVYLDFDHVGSSLATPDGVTLYGFSVANAKGVFVNAKAEIVDENTVKVWSDVTENPVDVSYCYDNLSVTSNLYGTQNGEVFLPVAPFITTNDPETVHAQNNSWYEVDDQKLTHFVGTKFGEYNSWTADGAAAQIINDVKASGEGALKLGYTNDADTFYAAPTLTGENEERFTDLNYNYSFYDRIDFKVKNEGAEITLNKLAFCSDGTWYYANIDKSLPSDSGWVSVTANLNRLTDDKGASYNNSGKLCSVTEIRVYFTKTSGEGAVYIDEFSLGNESYGAYKEVPSPVKTASVTDMGVSISYGAVTNTAYIGDLYLMHNSDGADASASDYFEFDFYINDYDEVKRLSGLGYSFAMWIASDPSNRFASRCSFGISDMITKTGWNHIRVKLSDITYKEDGFSFANMYYFYITCNNASGERCDTSLYVKLSNFSHTVHAGDINGDGNINVLDLIRYKKVMLSDTEDYDALALDVDRSGKAEHAADFISLRKLLFELF